jgi:hypothetical protein
MTRRSSNTTGAGLALLLLCPQPIPIPARTPIPARDILQVNKVTSLLRTWLNNYLMAQAISHQPAI